MQKFDKHFYDFIYGTIHHHNIEGRADELIRTLGKGRWLEIGAACGYFVKLLREKGVDAWGIEISDYAVSESCAPGYLLKADAQNIPFPDNHFDVVTSWAVFGYNNEAETEQIIREVNRVGAKQYHTIDYQITDMAPNYPYDYVFMKPREWFDKRMKNYA